MWLAVGTHYGITEEFCVIFAARKNPPELKVALHLYTNIFAEGNPHSEGRNGCVVFSKTSRFGFWCTKYTTNIYCNVTVCVLCMTMH